MSEQKIGAAKAILTDVTKCIGCERCVDGCVEQNKLPREIPTRYRSDDGLSARRLTSIMRISGRAEGSWRNVRRQCMHCLEPTCVAACLVGAFTKTADGEVSYDASKCIGCRYCMIACPFGIPRYEYDKPLPYVRKCKMNDECRVAGGLPACVAACPTKATIFGPRDALIEEARGRIAAAPDRYIDHIWGEHEFGGTSVIYISDVPLGPTLRIPTDPELAAMRVPALATTSVPYMLHDWVLVTPFQFATVSVGLAGIWFLRRRSRLMAERETAATDREAPGGSATASGREPGDED